VERKIIKAFDMHNKKDIEFELLVDENEQTDILKMSIEYNDMVFAENGEYYFNVFQIMRDKLLKNNIGLKCYGAMLNVCQSAMASYTENIYVLTMGKQTLLMDLVNMFDYIDIDMFPSTDEQKQFFGEWIRSLNQ